MKTPYISNIIPFSAHDGPELRTVVFVSGCPLDCRWCHNPESRLYTPGVFYSPSLCIGCGLCAAVCQAGCHKCENGHIYDRKNCILCGKCAIICPSGALTATAKSHTVEEIISIIKRDKPFYGSEGGITISGGEPLAFPEFTLSLLKAAKGEGINTCVETCGYAEKSVFEQISPYTDLILFDIKDTSPQRHREYTGKSNEKILENLYYADSLGIKTILRCVMVKGVNMTDSHYEGIRDTYKSLKNCLGVSLLKCHSYGEGKRERLGLPNAYDTGWTPNSADMDLSIAKLKDILIQE